MSAMDFRWEVWDNQALTAAEVSHTNGSLKDLEEGGVTDESIDGSLWFHFQVGTVFAGLDSGVMISVITSDSATFASGNIPLVGVGQTTYPLPVASLVAGARWSIAVDIFRLHKYLGVAFEPVSENASGGTLDAWFDLNPINAPKQQKFPAGYA